jgi:hypothetical protein
VEFANEQLLGALVEGPVLRGTLGLPPFLSDQRRCRASGSSIRSLMLEELRESGDGSAWVFFLGKMPHTP